jgi:NAD(P)-dependent dehydrogenase (short-subunit alcohol dehydrogenase family)
LARIFITGTNRGLGLEFAKQYLTRGEQVISTCRNPNTAVELQKLKENYKDNLLILKLEVTEQEERKRVHKEVKENFKAIDIFINNAGIRSGGMDDGYVLGELHNEDMTKVFNVNSIAPVLLVEQFLDLIKKGNNPKIINITSWLGSITNKTWLFRYSYCASKTALNMFSKLMSIQLKEKGIIVIPLHPGHVQTDLGGYSAPLTPKQSIEEMIKVIDSLTLKDTGKYLSWQGEEILW